MEEAINIFPKEKFVIGEPYQRKDMDEKIGETKINNRSGSGVFSFDNTVVLLVTLEQDLSEDENSYEDFFEYPEFVWSSQKKGPHSKPTTPVMKRMLEGGAELFVRQKAKNASKTNPYIFCGSIDALSHGIPEGDESPFKVKFELIENIQGVNNEIDNLINWKPINYKNSKASYIISSLTKKKTKSKKASSTSQGYQADKEIRNAIENYAMHLAIKHYESKGLKVKDVSQEKVGYDLFCDSNKMSFGVEVKGTRSSGNKVIVTDGEVRKAEEVNVELFVVSMIEVKYGLEKKNVVCSLGQWSVISPWKPLHKSLKPKTYDYELPAVKWKEV